MFLNVLFLTLNVDSIPIAKGIALCGIVNSIVHILIIFTKNHQGPSWLLKIYVHKEKLLRPNVHML